MLEALWNKNFLYLYIERICIHRKTKKNQHTVIDFVCILSNNSIMIFVYGEVAERSIASECKSDASRLRRFKSYSPQNAHQNKYYYLSPQ